MSKQIDAFVITESFDPNGPSSICMEGICLRENGTNILSQRLAPIITVLNFSCDLPQITIGLEQIDDQATLVSSPPSYMEHIKLDLCQSDKLTELHIETEQIPGPAPSRLALNLGRPHHLRESYSQWHSFWHRLMHPSYYGEHQISPHDYKLFPHSKPFFHDMPSKKAGGADSLSPLRENSQGSTKDLIALAEKNVGKPVWARTKFASLCKQGILGCAATVSDLLQKSGVPIAGSSNVYGVVNQLADIGWERVKITNKNQFHAGDIVYGTKGSQGHIGLITGAKDNQVIVCDNSSSSGTLKERSLEESGSFVPGGRFSDSLYVMRPKSS